jgi:hypothetical protein
LSAQKETKTDLVHLRSLPAAQPATSTGRVDWVWPEIQAGVPTGKASDVFDAVQPHGLAVGIRAMVKRDFGWEIRMLRRLGLLEVVAFRHGGHLAWNLRAIVCSGISGPSVETRPLAPLTASPKACVFNNVNIVQVLSMICQERSTKSTSAKETRRAEKAGSGT